MRLGRRTKLTAAVADRIVEVLEIGGYVETAAQAAGVSRRTFHAWMERGDPEGTRKADEPFRDFRERVDQARARGEIALVGIVSASSDWRAAAWMLERQYPEHWGGPRSRRRAGSIHPDDFAAGETSAIDPSAIVDDQLDRNGRPL